MRNKIQIQKRQTIKKRLLMRRPRTLRSKIIISLLFIVALVSLYFLTAPFIPRLVFLVKRPHINPTSYQKAASATKAGQEPSSDGPAQKPGNRLVLPDIGLDTQIIEGKSIYAIAKNQGVWHETSTIDPTEPGNIVLAGHRWIGYDVRNVGQFYNLPELKVGSKIYISWDDKVYEYEVYNTRSVYPTQVDIRDSDPNVPRKLTMYTCYPLGSTAKRFVVEAKQL